MGAWRLHWEQRDGTRLGALPGAWAWAQGAWGMAPVARAHGAYTGSNGTGHVHGRLGHGSMLLEPGTWAPGSLEPGRLGHGSMGPDRVPPYSSITDQIPSTPSVDLFSVET